MKAETTFSLKDQLFNAEKVQYLGGLFKQVYPEFRHDSFQKAVVSKFPELELKERIAHISTCLREHLPADYPDALEILLRALPAELDPNKTDDDFGDFIFSPHSLFVATYGCSDGLLDLSLPALKEITKRFSAEYAIRFFINAFPEKTFTYIHNWMEDDNYHVRRLTSEGTRPKLPWAQKLDIPYDKPMPVLHTLHADNTRYVTRSVANHLNDISKIDPDLVLETLIEWKKGKQQDKKEMHFITKHTLRSLVKQGHMDALDLLGFGGKPDIEITKFEMHTPVVKVGDAFEFTLAFDSNKSQNLVIDYLMNFAGDESKSGKKAGQKVFKLKQLELEAGQTINIRKKHPMRLMTTRRLYPGEHQIALQVNGQNFGTLSFDLVA